MADTGFTRVLLKLSGEALMGENEHGIDPATLDRVAEELISSLSNGTGIAIVCGGGNIFRGLKGAAQGMDRATGDQMGMLATIINGLALQDALIRAGHKPALFSAIEIEGVARVFNRRDAMDAMDAGRIVILPGGTGRPFFTTDTAAALRACELGCDILLKASHVDGVYDKDPAKHDDAVKYTKLSFDEAIEKQLGVVDQTAFSMLRENGIPLMVFDLHTAGNLPRAIAGDELIGTMVGV